MLLLLTNVFVVTINFIVDVVPLLVLLVGSFQVASSTLDASAKIYAGRVDSMYNDAFKVLGGLGREHHGNAFIRKQMLMHRSSVSDSYTPEYSTQHWAEAG